MVGREKRPPRINRPQQAFVACSLAWMIRAMTALVVVLLLIWFSVSLHLLLASSSSNDPSSPSSMSSASVVATNSNNNNSTIIHQYYGISPIKLRLPTPVLVVGFPKSGTTSVWHYFNCSGVITQHFCCCGDLTDHPPCTQKSRSMAKCIIHNMRQNRTMLAGCGDYDVYAQLDGERLTRRLRPKVWQLPLENGTNEIVDNNVQRPIGYEMRHFLPQVFYLERLHHELPRATFVLPLRNASEWAFSVFNWFEMRGRVINEYIHHNASIQRPGKQRSMEFLAHIYRQHTAYVREFVKQHPSHTLVEFEIHEPDAGDILAEAFGLPTTCWTQKNQAGDRAKFDTVEEAVNSKNTRTTTRKKKKRW